MNDVLTDRVTDWYECVLYTEIWHATLENPGCVMLDVNQAADGDRRVYLCTMHFTLRALMCVPQRSRREENWMTTWKSVVLPVEI